MEANNRTAKTNLPTAWQPREGAPGCFIPPLRLPAPLNFMKLLLTTNYGGLLVQVGRFALSVERNHPIYGKRIGVRVLRPFLSYGAGLHLWPVLIHIHTNRQPRYGQP